MTIFFTVHNKCLKIPLPSSKHFAARVRRLRVVCQIFHITLHKILTIPTESPSRHKHKPADFVVLLTVHLSIFILAINQPDAQNLFYNKFISCLYMFRAPCAHRQEVKIVLYSIWYRHTETSEWSKVTKIIKLLKYINMSTW